MTNKDTNNLIVTACSYFGSPFDDRTDDYSIFYAPHGQEPEHVTLHQVADVMKISTVKVRKLLISGNYYSTERSREIQERYSELVEIYTSQGLNQPQAEKKAVLTICDEMKLGKASVYSYLPFKNTAYGIEEKSSTAIRQERYRKRKNPERYKLSGQQ